MGRGLAQTAQTLRCSERTLRRYASGGLLRAEGGGREVRIPVDEERYLRSHWELLSGLRRSLRTEHAVRLAALYGSMATGEDHRNSDVDVLIVHRGTRRQRFALRRRLEEVLGRDVHLVLLEDAERSPSLLADVLCEGRVIVDRDQIWPTLQRRKSRVLRAAIHQEQEDANAARVAMAKARERAGV